MSNLKLLLMTGATCGLACLVNCGGGPSRTETTRSTSVQQTEEGGEVRRTTSQTRETARDGTETTHRTETTDTSSPAPR